MSSQRPYFTIFTPVYNGANHLCRVFESVKNQSFTNFEWLIVNDGSTDESGKLIQDFIAENPTLNIRYVEQENCGKHQSWNKAVDLANGELFVPADADDYFLPHTLQFFHDKWCGINADVRENLSGINVLCLDNDSSDIVGNRFPEDGFVSNNLDLYYRVGLEGEKWGCIRTDLLRSRKFPLVDGAFYPESYIWFYFSKKYNLICFNEPLRRYYTTQTGLSAGNHFMRKSPRQAKVELHYQLWFLKNFGLYLIRYAFKDLIHNLLIMGLNIFVLIKSFLKRK